MDAMAQQRFGVRRLIETRRAQHDTNVLQARHETESVGQG